MIQISNLSKSYGIQELFLNVDLQVNPQEKIGLVGRNGHGKTTLFRLIIGEEEPDTGVIALPKNYKLGYVKQNLQFTQNTVIKEGSLNLPAEQKDAFWLAEKILFGLGFDQPMLERSPDQLSGGYQVRLNLAKTLLANPNMLLLDEPTNYLDITSIRWLINFLKNWKNELILITHDRGFMDQIVTHTAIIHRKKIKKMKGSTAALYLQIAQEEEVYEKQRINDEKKQKSIETFINRFRAKARLSTLVQSRIKLLERKEKKEKLEEIKNLDFQFNYSLFESHTLINIKKLCFSYQNSQPLINDFSLMINKKERIAIIGPNGKGKTTLLKLIAGELQPISGNINYHSQIRIGYFGQTYHQELHPEHSVEEEINLSCTDGNFQLARDICGCLLFTGDQALKKIKYLSGGEKSRVLLGKILVKPINLLLLDEPTNHLDMESCDALLAAIDYFEGAVVIVTHNEMFLHAIGERLVVFDKNQISLYESNYQNFLNTIGWQSENEDRKLTDKEKSGIEVKLSSKEIRKKKAELIEARSKILKPIEKKYTELENKIKEFETRYNFLQEEIINSAKEKKGEKIGSLSKEIHILEKEIDESYQKLDEVMQIYEREQQRFEEMMTEFNDSIS